ncbi:MAG: TatD family hydrolase [Cyclobacteriaceae bacterium]|nr:TatD family hydrolase [Cyclobacteriaceae bacterium]
MAFIDTHAHIYLDQFGQDLGEVIRRAHEATVDKIYMPNIDSQSIERMIGIEEEVTVACYAMMGLHPCSVNESMDREIRNMEDWLVRRKFRGIGETGTDLYWDKTFYERQVESLEIHISWAKKYRIPIILHSRDSLDQTLSIIEKNFDDRLRGIFHCFTGNVDQARRIMDLDFLMGIGGVLTFRNSNLDKIIEQLPLSHLVLETDSPYLAPVPNRGKRNEPGYLPLIAGKLAEIFGMPVNEIAKITSENAEKIFQDT